MAATALPRANYGHPRRRNVDAATLAAIEATIRDNPGLTVVSIAAAAGCAEKDVRAAINLWENAGRLMCDDGHGGLSFYEEA